MDFYNTSQIPPDLAEKSFAANIARVMPNGTAPLYAMSGLAKKKIAKDIEHGYWTKSMKFTNVTIATAIEAVDTTTFELASTDGVLRNQVIRFPRSFAGEAYQAPEFVQVISVNRANNTIEVARGFGDTVPLAEIPAGTTAAAVANAHEEGSVKPDPRAIIPERIMNYTQIFRNGWAQTRTLAAVKMIVGDGAVQENKRDAMAFHATDIEYATMFSRKSMSTGPQGNPLHTMDGIEAVISRHAPQNLREAGATTSYDQLEDMLDPMLDLTTDFMNGNSRTIFTGKHGLKVINNIGRLSGEYQLVDQQTNFGLSFRTFQTTRGRFNLVEHPLLNVNEEFARMAFVMDLSSFDFAHLEGRDTQIEYINGDMKSTDGTDADGGVLTTELTTEIRNPFAMGILYNLRQGVGS